MWGILELSLTQNHRSGNGPWIRLDLLVIAPGVFGYTIWGLFRIARDVEKLTAIKQRKLSRDEEKRKTETRG